MGLKFGKMTPAPEAELKGQDFDAHTDTFALHISSHMIPAEAIGQYDHIIPVQGGVFFFLRGKETSYIIFKNFLKYTGLSQRYLDVIYENAKSMLILLNVKRPYR